MDENPNIKSARGQNDSGYKESFLKQSFKNNSLKDEKPINEYLMYSVVNSIDYVVDYLEKTDTIMNFTGLSELFHKKGLNMRFAWMVFLKLEKQRAKALVGADILARCIKKLIGIKSSKKNKYFLNSAKSEPFANKDRIDELIIDKNEFVMENYAKTLLVQYITILVKSGNEGGSGLQLPNSKKVPQNMNYQDEEGIFEELSTELFFNKMRIFDFAKKLLNSNEFDIYLSTEIIRTVMNYPCLQANVFFDVSYLYLKPFYH